MLTNRTIVTSEKTSKLNPNQTNQSTRRRAEQSEKPREFGGRKKGLEPTRYGDWEKNGRCIDF
jgi:hypothetical protein